MTSGFEIGSWETLPEAKGPYTIPETDETADDLAG